MLVDMAKLVESVAVTVILLVRAEPLAVKFVATPGVPCVAARPEMAFVLTEIAGPITLKVAVKSSIRQFGVLLAFVPLYP